MFETKGSERMKVKKLCTCAFTKETQNHRHIIMVLKHNEEKRDTAAPDGKMLIKNTTRHENLKFSNLFSI